MVQFCCLKMGQLQSVLSRVNSVCMNEIQAGYKCENLKGIVSEQGAVDTNCSISLD